MVVGFVSFESAEQLKSAVEVYLMFQLYRNPVIHKHVVSFLTGIINSVQFERNWKGNLLATRF